MSYDTPPLAAGLTGAVTRFRSGVHRLQLFALSVVEILDVVLPYAQPTVLVFGVSYFVRDMRPRGEQSLADLADVLRIPCDASPDRDIIAIAREDLETILSGIFHWNFHCWDAPRVPLRSVMNRQAAVMENQSRWLHDTPALHLLDGARLFIYSHDDEYLTVESRQQSFVKEVFSRALQKMAARAMDRAAGTVSAKAAEVPTEVIDHLWATVPAFEFRAALPAPTDRRVSVAFGAHDIGQWPLWQRDFQPRGHLLYDRPSGVWMIRYH
jgi:hypothetical protein